MHKHGCRMECLQGGVGLRCTVTKNMMCLVLVCMFAIAVGCEVPETENFVEADLRVAVPAGVETVPLAVALEGGYFEGVFVDLVPVSGPTEMETLLQSGAVDGAVSNLFSLVKLQEQGFLVLAASVSAADYMVVRAAGEADLITDLAGMTLAVSEESYEQYLLEAVIQRYDLDPSDLEYYPTTNSVQALKGLGQKETTAAFLPRHLGEEALKDGALFVSSTLEQDLPGGVMIFSGEALQNKEDSIQLFYQGYLQTLEVLNSGETYDFSFLGEKWDYPEWWLEGISGSFALPRVLARDEVNAALAWYKENEEVETVAVYEALIWREQFWE